MLIKIYSVSFFEAFPTAIAPMSVNWADDGIHRLPVTFRYEYWMTVDLESDSLGVATVSNRRTKIPASGTTPPIIGTQPTQAAPVNSDSRGPNARRGPRRGN